MNRGHWKVEVEKCVAEQDRLREDAAARLQERLERVATQAVWHAKVDGGTGATGGGTTSPMPPGEEEHEEHEKQLSQAAEEAKQLLVAKRREWAKRGQER